MLKFVMIDGKIKFPIKKVNKRFYFIDDTIPETTEKDEVISYPENVLISQSIIDHCNSTKYETIEEAVEYVKSVS